jgi:hypothetical protein
MVIIRRNQFEGLELDDDTCVVTNNTQSHNSNLNSTSNSTTSYNKSYVKAHSIIDANDNDNNNDTDNDDFIKVERKTSKNDHYKSKKTRK